jgi:hypothetical protein
MIINENKLKKIQIVELPLSFIDYFKKYFQMTDN